MPAPHRANIALLDRILLRAAESLGDLAPAAIELFYSRHGEARAAFERHGLGKREQLEADMVETALYCLMTWVERPGEVAIMLYGSVPHHSNTLHVRPEWYRCLLDSVIDLVAATIPPEAAQETALIDEIRACLQGAIDEALECQIMPLRVQSTA